MPELKVVAPSVPFYRRWLPRPRFSLRTLLLFVFLCGSAFGLWWRYDAGG